MWGRREADRELLVDTMLMVALASGPPSRSLFDNLQRLLTEPDALLGWDWTQLVDRIEQLAADAPLFFDARPHVVENLRDPKSAALALEAGVRLAAAAHPLDEGTKAIYQSLASGLGVDDAPWIWERAEATPSDDAPFKRTRFNDPLGPQPADLFDAIAETRDPEALRLLLFKLSAARDAIDWAIEPPRRLAAVGTLHEVGDCRLRFDAEIDCVGRRVRVRALGPGESLYPEEHEAVKSFVLDHMRPTDSVLLVHFDELSVADAALVAVFSPTQLRAFRAPSPS